MSELIGDEKLRQLFERALAGDRAAYQSFLEIIAERLRAELKDEDCVQGALIALHEKRDLYRPGMPIMPWVHRIAGVRAPGKSTVGQLLALVRRRRDEKT